MGKLWFNGAIYTMEAENRTVEAVYTENGRVVDAGSVQKLRSEHAPVEEMDLQGASMYPGFQDSHLHMLGLGETLLSLDFSGMESAAEMKQALQEKKSRLAPGQWLTGEGWNENNFTDRKIFHRWELDEIADGSPVLLTRICRHAALANSKALNLAGITEETPDPPGGIIVRDEQGRPTGYLLDTAVDIVKQVMPEVRDEELREALQAAVQEMLRKGLTGGHTEDLNYYGGFKRTFQVFKDLINHRSLKFRTNLLVHHEVLEDMHHHGFRFGPVNDSLSFGAVKIFADGALGARTALLQRPYNDAPETRGVAVTSKEDMKSIVKRAREKGMPAAVHVIGDAALEYTVEVLEKNPPPEGTRDRLIHAQVTPPDLIARLQQMSVVLDLQPRFVVSDFPWVQERLGEERLRCSFAWKTLLGAGLHCAGSSDAPIEPVSPLEGIHAAVARRKAGSSHDGWLPDEKLSRFGAVQLYTRGSAQAVSAEEEYGIIAPGFRADFTILENDIFQVPLDEIVTTAVKAVVVDDTLQYGTLTT
ncbi:amidohydrolase [Salibacterium lacus]|uniref:Amidohydrolase n=1 Tax=Salibacterium lacus TaxID=1898109 RepID=A0ABW5T364_9BACI